jgi:hypothetical protein
LKHEDKVEVATADEVVVVVTFTYPVAVETTVVRSVIVVSVVEIAVTVETAVPV